MRIIGGKMRGKKLASPDTEATRPTSDRARESLFNLLDNHLRRLGKPWADVIFADVFAGTGAVGTEALSRGAAKSYFFETDKGALKSLRQNIADVESQTVIFSDALRPPKIDEKPDIIFMDPPYGHGLWLEALKVLDRQGWVDGETYIVVEVDKGENDRLPQGYELLDKRAYGRNTFLFVQKG